MKDLHLLRNLVFLKRNCQTLRFQEQRWKKTKIDFSNVWKEGAPLLAETAPPWTATTVGPPRISQRIEKKERLFAAPEAVEAPIKASGTHWMGGPWAWSGPWIGPWWTLVLNFKSYNLLRCTVVCLFATRYLKFCNFAFATNLCNLPPQGTAVCLFATGALPGSTKPKYSDQCTTIAWIRRGGGLDFSRVGWERRVSSPKRTNPLEF